jgi:hypothetical protein
LHAHCEQATLQRVVIPHRALFCSFLALATTLGCGAGRDRKPPGVPPSPASVTREEPGGDASNPHKAALDRLLTEPWGWRNDKQDVFHFPLSDWPNWRRVRFWGLPAFVGFRYGDAHRAVTGLWVRRLRPDDPEQLEVCLDRMQAWGKPIASAYQTTFTMGPRSFASWKSKDDVLVQSVDAEVSALFSHRTYRAVVGVSFAWPRVCVLYGYAFRVEGEEDVAAQVRDRYAREAFSRLTVRDPLRSPDGVQELPLLDDGSDDLGATLSR